MCSSCVRFIKQALVRQKIWKQKPVEAYREGINEGNTWLIPSQGQIPRYEYGVGPALGEDCEA